jgi:hypothetical protein
VPIVKEIASKKGVSRNDTSRSCHFVSGKVRVSIICVLSLRGSKTPPIIIDGLSIMDSRDILVPMGLQSRQATAKSLGIIDRYYLSS